MWNTDCDGSWGFSYFSIKIGETAQTGKVFPLKWSYMGIRRCRSLASSKDVIPRQRRFTSVLTERRLLENCAAFQNPVVVTGL
jgi:hypothetical protein